MSYSSKAKTLPKNALRLRDEKAASPKACRLVVGALSKVLYPSFSRSVAIRKPSIKAQGLYNFSARLIRMIAIREPCLHSRSGNQVERLALKQSRSTRIAASYLVR